MKYLIRKLKIFVLKGKIYHLEQDVMLGVERWSDVKDTIEMYECKIEKLQQ